MFDWHSPGVSVSSQSSTHYCLLHSLRFLWWWCKKGLRSNSIGFVCHICIFDIFFKNLYVGGSDSQNPLGYASDACKQGSMHALVPFFPVQLLMAFVRPSDKLRLHVVLIIVENVAEILVDFYMLVFSNTWLSLWGKPAVRSVVPFAKFCLRFTLCTQHLIHCQQRPVA